MILDVHDSDVESDETLWDLYERWITHWKVSRCLDEKNKRFATFKKHAKHIHLKNKKDSITCKPELNWLADMTIEEFESKDHKVSFQHLEIHDRDVESDETLLDLYGCWMTHYEQSRSLDEKNKRFVVFKEQVQYIHSQNKRGGMAYKLGLISFSDMTRDEYESKCMGGFSPDDILKLWCRIHEMGGVRTEEDYNQGKMDGPRVNISGFGVVPHNDEEALQKAVCMQPVVVCVDSRGDAFMNYSGGVLTEEVGKEPFLSVVVVGYGVTPDGVKFWKILNSWGEKWGEDGYMRIKRGVNLCGIASFASFPTGPRLV